MSSHSDSSSPSSGGVASARFSQDCLAGDARSGGRTLDDILGSIEKKEILGALHRANSQRTLAARMLGISRSRLYRRMEALGIDPRRIGVGEMG